MLRVLFAKRKTAAKSPAIFLDRDGVINRRRPDYVLTWAQFKFLPDILPALRRLSTLHLPMIVISNQSAVGRGLLTSSVLRRITELMYKAMDNDGTCLTAAYFCTHTPNQGCLCRKPKPGLLQAAAADFNIDLRHSIFIGDSDSDAQAAITAGCQPVLFGRSLNLSADAVDCLKNVPVAHTGKDLFGVAVRSLRLAKHQR